MVEHVRIVRLFAQVEMSDGSVVSKPGLERRKVVSSASPTRQAQTVQEDIELEELASPTSPSASLDRVSGFPIPMERHSAQRSPLQSPRHYMLGKKR